MLKPYRSRLLTSTLLVSAALAATPAFAQDADPANQPKTGIQENNPAAPAAGVSTQDSAPPAAENSSGEIVVTGTLIRNPNLVSAVPVAVVGQEEISLRGTGNAEQILRDLPGAVPSIGSAVNNGNGGASYVDLRGLGSFRNVVLLDGARIVPSGLVGRVDLNNIPLALVERTEVLTGGAATTYGADAVSGVVNFITRSDFSGFEAQVSNAITEQGDGNAVRADITVGANFDDGRGNAVFSIGYQQADPVYQGSRGYSLFSIDSFTGAAGGSGTTSPSRFTGGGSGTRQIDPVTGALGAAGVFNPYNFNPFNVLFTPFERFNMYGAGHYEVADGIDFYTRGLFSKNEVQTILAPAGLFGEQITINLNNPYLPAAARAQFCANSDFDPVTAGVQSLTTAQCNAAAVATGPTDPNYRTFTSTVSRRTPEGGSRISRYATTIFDYKAGVRLDLTDKVNLDVNGSYGESENRLTQTGYLRSSLIRQASLASRDATGNIVCNNTANGCVPINLFGPTGSITQDQIDFVAADSQVTTRVSLAQARALLSGEVGFGSPFSDDNVNFAVGGEFRRYRASQEADILSSQAGELSGTGGATPSFAGGFQVYEAFGELVVPLVTDRPFFKSLTATGGIRYSDYTIAGTGGEGFSTTTYKGEGTWEPADGIKVRGNYQRAVRAPNINELFAPVNTGLTNLNNDPCASVLSDGSRRASPTGELRAICLAQGATLANINDIEQPSANQANQTSGGNLGLRPEKSDSYGFGVLVQPAFIPGFSVSVDYYNIKIKGAIGFPTVDDAISACFGDAAGTSPAAGASLTTACTQIRRDPVTGALSGSPATTPGLFLAPSNLGTILTDGIDVNVAYRRDLGFAKLNLNFNGNWTNRSRYQATPTSINRECVGLYSGNCGSPGSAGPNSSPGSIQPEFTWNQRTTLTFGSVDLSVLWRHVDSVRYEEGDAFVGTIPASAGPLGGRTVNFNRIKAFDYFDFSGRIGVSDNVDLTLTVTNLFDKQPPIVGSSIGSTSFNSGNTYPSTYDALGRRYTMAARFKF